MHFRIVKQIRFFCVFQIAITLGLIPTVAWSGSAAEVLERIKGMSASEREAFLVNGAKKEGSLVFYSTISIDHGNKILAAFHQRYPFISTKLHRAAHTVLLSRTLAEARAGKYEVDVFSQNPETTFQMIQAGLIQPYFSPNRAAVRGELMDKNGNWTAAYHLVTVIAYNPELVKRQELPKKYEDLADPRWKGRLHLDPRDADWLHTLIEYWGEEKAVAFIKQLAGIEPYLRPGKTLAAQLMAAGEFAISPYLNGYRIAEMKSQGAPLDFLLLDPVISKPRVASLAKNAPHPHAGILFSDWILSKEAQTLLGKTLGRDPVRKDVKSKYERLDYPKYVAVNAETLGPMYERRLRQYQEILGYRQ